MPERVRVSNLTGVAVIPYISDVTSMQTESNGSYTGVVEFTGLTANLVTIGAIKARGTF